MEFSEWKEKYNGGFQKAEFFADNRIDYYISIKLTKEALRDLIKIDGFKEIKSDVFDNSFIIIFDTFPPK